MRKNSRKGFTIVELVIVIAVIAILAAVLIPTFSGIIDKANTSADIQLIREANMLIQAEMIDLDRSLTKKEADKVLTDNGIDISKITNTANVFYYLEEESQYVIFNLEDKKMTYPENIVEKYKDKAVSSWLKYDLTLDFKVNKQFSVDKDTKGFQQYVDTGVNINWNNDFTITETFVYESNKQPQMPFGNWTDSTGFNIELNRNKVEVWIHGSQRAGGESIQSGDCDLTFKWNASNRTFTLTLKQGNEVKVYYEKECEDLEKSEDKTLRLGAADHRPEYYKEIEVKSFQIAYAVGYGEIVHLPEAQSNINNYKFKGWYSALTDGTTLGEHDVTMPAADTTVYAQWINE